MKGTATRDQSYLGHGFHRFAYREWGNSANPRVLFWVHGLTRNAHDFDEFASAMSDHYRVICADVVGRGQSNWLKDYGHYDYPQYLADMNALIARLGLAEVDWVGTLMGGPVCSLLPCPTGDQRHLYLPKPALHRIGHYLGCAPDFDDLAGVKDYLHDVHLWSYWDRIAYPVLALRREASDLLTEEITRERTYHGPRAHLVAIPGVGHAPALNNDDQVAVIRDWLLNEGG